MQNPRISQSMLDAPYLPMEGILLPRTVREQDLAMGADLISRNALQFRHLPVNIVLKHFGMKTLIKRGVLGSL
jgi:hypothetical protein